jgi:hypothetical protein
MSPVLLEILGYTRDKIPRYRDCYLKDGHIVVYTRTGGGNRQYYENAEVCKANYPDDFKGNDFPAGPWNCDLRKNPLFLFDRDDSYAPTYAEFHYKYPEMYAKELTVLAEAYSEPQSEQKWAKAVESIRPLKPVIDGDRE